MTQGLYLSACHPGVSVCDAEVLSCSLFPFSLCVRCLTPVFCCDVVELGTYGKLKYYHSMTEEGKPLRFHYLIICVSLRHPSCVSHPSHESDVCFGLLVTFSLHTFDLTSLRFH